MYLVRIAELVVHHHDSTTILFIHSVCSTCGASIRLKITLNDFVRIGPTRHPQCM